MATVQPPFDHWLNDPVRSSISSFSVGNSDASIPRRFPDLSNIIPVVDDAFDSTLSSTRQVTRHGSSRRSTSDSLSSTSQSVTSIFSAPSTKSDDTATTYTLESEPPQIPTLHCDFSIAGCQIEYPITQFEYWYAHTLSHFAKLPPPPKCICIFCPEEFEDELHPHDNWRRRMIHCHDHLVTEGYKKPRPDFWLVEYLEKKGLITPHDADQANRHTERPMVAGLVPRNFETEEAKARNERNERYAVDTRKENRQRKDTSQRKTKNK